MRREANWARCAEGASATDLAWGAGLFEGEGTITLDNQGRPYVSIANTDWQVIEFFAERWPAYLKQRKSLNPNGRPAWDWRLGGARSVRFLEAIAPFLRTERVRGKAELLIEAYGLPSAERSAHITRIRLLNRRGLVAV